MERMAWTDERLEERFNGIDRRFEGVDRRFDEVDRRFDEVDRRFDRVEREIAGIRTTLNRVGGGIIVGFGSVIFSILAKGA